MTTLSKKFSSVFDVTNEDHVLWLRALHLATRSEQAPDLLMNHNPFGITVSKKEMLEWVDVMFSMAMKYSMAVLDGTAWIPPKREAVGSETLERTASARPGGGLARTSSTIV